MPDLWPPSPAPSDAAIRATFEQITNTLAVASGLAATGRTVDLAGLEDAAGALCAKILDLPPAQGADFRTALMELDGRLASLAATIQGAT